MLARLRSNTCTHAISLEAAETAGGPSNFAEELITATHSDCPDSRAAITPITAPHPAAPFQPRPCRCRVLCPSLPPAQACSLTCQPRCPAPRANTSHSMRAHALTPHAQRLRLALDGSTPTAPRADHMVRILWQVHRASAMPGQCHAGPVPCRASAMSGQCHVGQCHAYCGRPTELGRARTPVTNGTACARITAACKAQLCSARGSTAPASAAVASGADFASGGRASDDAAGDGREHRDCAARGAGYVGLFFPVCMHTASASLATGLLAAAA
jgi:hypothetical protein